MDLYYYTTAETMKFILTNGDIFATHISYLNDSEEYVNGLRELRNLLQSNNCAESDLHSAAVRCLDEAAYNDAIRNVPQIYSISFSRESDLLSQWYMYSRESGVRLKMCMPQKRARFCVKDKQGNGKTDLMEVGAELKDVHYFTRIGMETKEYTSEEKKIIKMIDKYITDQKMENDLEGNIIKIWKDTAPFIKNYEFRQEKEVRLVFKAPQNEKKAALIEYRSARGVLIPYLDIYMQKGWPVVEIMVGPGRNQERVFNSICHFIDCVALKISPVDQCKNMKSFLNGMLRYQIDEEKINEYKEKIENSVNNIITYKAAIYDCLKNTDDKVEEYLRRNYYSESGVIVRKSNAPYEF